MADAWDAGDDDDDWDVPDDDDELDKRLGLKKLQEDLPTFDDEEDLAVKDAAAQEKMQQAELKKKGTALAAKKRAEKERLEELEIAKRAMELEAELEENLSADELKRRKQQQVEDADHALTADLFGAVEAVSTSRSSAAGAGGAAMAAGDKVVMKDIKDHLKHARKVAECIRGHGKITLALTFLREVIQECKDVLDDDSISELIKTMNVIKNEKVQAAKRKVKGQAQKSKKADKVAEAKAREKLVETFGDNDIYDEIDQVANDYEDAFF